VSAAGATLPSSTRTSCSPGWASAIRPTALRPSSVNQTAPSAPATIAPSRRSPPPVPNGISVVSNVSKIGVARTIPASPAVAQRLPSKPVVIPRNSAATERTAFHLIVPPGVIRPIWFDAVNHTLPSGPAVIARGCQRRAGPTSAALTGNSVIVPPGVIRPIAPRASAPP
jgi:hypothetical protein